MIILFQLLIFIIILIASFCGFKVLIPIIILIILFSFANIFTLDLLAIQSTTILIAGGIGVLVCIIKVFSKTLDDLSDPNSSTDIDFSYLKNLSFTFLPSFIIVNFLRFCIGSVGSFLCMFIYDIHGSSGFHEGLFALILAASLFLNALISNKISYKDNSAIKEYSPTSIIVALLCLLLGAFIGGRILSSILGFI